MKDGCEIEKKYLVDTLPLDYELGVKKHIIQTYLYINNIMDIRVRDVECNGEHKYYYTVKMSYTGDLYTRREIESEIDESLYMSLVTNIALGTKPIVKDRFVYPLGGGYNAEIDIYDEELYGLRTVEVEFDSLFHMDFFSEPEWFGKEVTEDENYRNRSLCKGEFPSNVRLQLINKGEK